MLKNIKTKPFLKLLTVFVLTWSVIILMAEEKKETKKSMPPALSSELLNGLKFRSIGPAFTSGRIADFAVNPKNFSEFYVAVASGHIWKTTNRGITFEPVFDNYGAYSIGCLAIDPQNPNVVWAGTGENNHQRALGYGNGVYKTLDGGKTWQNMGLKESRQIGMILIDPRDSNIVYVAAEGSVWGPGGDRGLYKTTDGGKTWQRILYISENTGINNIICDPRYPDILYATSEQRRRHVHTKIGGGPETAIFKSEDAGKTWRKLSRGLPTEDMGGIGIAISPQNPDVLYAIIEAARDSGGFFRSTDRGESWTKMSDHTSSGQYYNEIFCDPLQFDKVYSVETVTYFTTDGGKSWQRLGLEDRHVDDHALWINPKDNNNIMIGGDGGIYITYDGGKKWYHVSNLPVTQFYRVTTDNREPFYFVYGGTQDNNTLGGPSRNINEAGVTSGEWVVTVGGDGFWSRVDPQNPDIVYSEWQYGNIVRYDKKSGERLYIKPQPQKGEKTFRWNWNTPFIISNHLPTRLYIAANKVFQSDDRGNSWKAISDDLTAGIDRNSWPVMGKFWSADAVAKDVSTSLFGTIVALDESPVKENLLYVGTDDGLIQVTEDGGKNWRKIDSFPGVPKYTYVSDIFASRFDENIVFASFCNIKNDDFKPYLLKSTDKGRTWVSITADLPLNGSVHTIEQDFVNPDLLFVGTEFGVFFSYNGGRNWVQLKSGLPDVAVYDLAIQKRESDLVLATFGRGIYILDDYSPLRKINPQLLKQQAELFAPRDALLYIQKEKLYGQGATYFCAPNPDYGAVFTLYLYDLPLTRRQKRIEMEKKLFAESKPIPQPSWKELEDEAKQIPPYLLITIRDSENSVVRTMTHKPVKGIQRFNWDLKYDSIEIQKVDKFDPFKRQTGSIYVLPGKFSAEVELIFDGQKTKIAGPVFFNVRVLNNSALPVKNRPENVLFQQKVSRLTKSMLGALQLTRDMQKEIIAVKQTALTLPAAHEGLMTEIETTEKEVDDILFAFLGVQPKASSEEIPPADYPLYSRLDDLINTLIESTADITETSKQIFAILNEEFPPLLERIKKVFQQLLPEIRVKLNKLEAPYTPQRLPDWK